MSPERNSNTDMYSIIAQRYYQSIYNHCYVQLRFCKQAAEDCTQEVFLRLYQKWSLLNKDQNIRAWLYKTSQYVMKNYLRKHTNKEESLEEMDEVPMDEDNAEGIISILDCLSIEEQLFTQRYFMQGISVKELTLELGISEDAVYQRASRIKQKLRRYFSLN